LHRTLDICSGALASSDTATQPQTRHYSGRYPVGQSGRRRARRSATVRRSCKASKAQPHPSAGCLPIMDPGT